MTPGNPLTYMGDRARAVVYAAYAIIGVILGATQVGYAAAEVGQPVWLTVTLAVFAFLGGAIGYTAVTHTPKDGSAVS